MARGVKMGRKPKLTPHQMKEARRRVDAGEPMRDIARSFNVSAFDDFAAGGVTAAASPCRSLECYACWPGKNSAIRTLRTVSRSSLWVSIIGMVSSIIASTSAISFRRR